MANAIWCLIGLTVWMSLYQGCCHCEGVSRGWKFHCWKPLVCICALENTIFCRNGGNNMELLCVANLIIYGLLAHFVLCDKSNPVFLCCFVSKTSHGETKHIVYMLLQFYGVTMHLIGLFCNGIENTNVQKQVVLVITLLMIFSLKDNAISQ